MSDEEDVTVKHLNYCRNIIIIMVVVVVVVVSIEPFKHKHCFLCLLLFRPTGNPIRCLPFLANHSCIEKMVRKKEKMVRKK